MWLPDFFYSKTFKIITTVIISVNLMIIITLKIVDLYCDEPGCWNKKVSGTYYCMDHINSIYEEVMKRERAYENSQRKNSTSNSYSNKSQRSYSSGKKSTPSRSYNTYSNSYSSCGGELVEGKYISNSLWNDSLLVKYSEFGYNDACISSGADC